MVDARTYRLWAELAGREDLPDAALTCVVDALTRPSTGETHTDAWRQEALKSVLPGLLARVHEPSARTQLIAAAGRGFVVAHLRGGALTVADLPAITAAHRVWADLVMTVAALPAGVPDAVRLLDDVEEFALDEIVSRWDAAHRAGVPDAPADPMPEELADAILDRALAPLAAALARPQDTEWQMDWTASAGVPGLGWEPQFTGSDWRILQRCPGRWEELVRHSRLGVAVRHLLLVNADTAALTDDLLAQCLPALTCPELADLPKPSITQRRRLREIARRVRRHPRILDIAAGEVHAAANACVRRGRLLNARNVPDHDVPRLADDLATVSGTPRDLVALCERLAALPSPTVVTETTPDDIPGLRARRTPQPPGLGWGQEHRVLALAHLATNPHTPRDAVVAVLDHLHCAEIAHLAETDAAPAWLRALAAERQPASDDGVIRLLGDDELGSHPDPAAVLASWLDASPHGDGTRRIERAVSRSRYCTEELLRRMPADTVLGHESPTIAAAVLIEACGNDPARWAALSAALGNLRAAGTFGELLDTRLARTPDRRSMPPAHA